jgi:hypothetical protein
MITLDYRSISLIGSLLVLLLPIASPASLVATLYRNQVVYVAGDSAMTDPSDLTRKPNATKIFPLADTCCACWTGIAEMALTNPVTGGPIALSIPARLEELCRDLSSTTGPLTNKINRLVTDITSRHYACMKEVLESGAISRETLRALGSLQLQLVGYDPTGEVFFSRTYTYQGTNDTIVTTNFEYRCGTVRGHLHTEGETTFFSGLVLGMDRKLRNLCPKEFRKDIQQLPSATPAISDQRVAECLWEMFRLHKLHAFRLGYARGCIGEPYLVFKITTNAITQIRESPLPSEPDGAANGSQPIRPETHSTSGAAGSRR